MSVGIFLPVYYAVVLFVFYRKDFLFSGRPARSLAPYLSEPGIDVHSAVHELLEDCKPVFQAALTQQLDKQQVLAALRDRVQRYPQIVGTSFQTAVTNHISQELEHRLALRLTDAEAGGLWS